MKGIGCHEGRDLSSSHGAASKPLPALFFEWVDHQLQWQRFTYPTGRVAELTPRLWKQHFAATSLRFDIHEFPA
jgi:hypothetical protein